MGRSGLGKHFFFFGLIPKIAPFIVNLLQLNTILIPIICLRWKKNKWYRRTGRNIKPHLYLKRLMLQIIKSSMGSKNLKCIIGHWTCITQNFKWVTWEVLLYTLSGASDTYKVFHGQQQSSVHWIGNHTSLI